MIGWQVSEVVLNDTFERDVLSRNPVLAASVNRKTSAVERAAKAKARRRTGALGDSVGSVTGIEFIRNVPTLIGRIYAKDFKAGWFEKGTRRQHADPFLLPALVEELPGAHIVPGPRP